jgi:hypothetical protein
MDLPPARDTKNKGDTMQTEFNYSELLALASAVAERQGDFEKFGMTSMAEFMGEILHKIDLMKKEELSIPLQV